jgi:hypothetical protein
MTAIDPSEAQIIVAAISVVGVLVTALTGLLVALLQAMRKRNDSDHAKNSGALAAIHDDVREVKADVRDVKDEVRSHGDRLRNLEHMTVTQDHTDEVVRSNGRKLQQIQDHQNREQAS